MYPEEFARPVKQQVLAQAKGYAYVCKQLLLLGVCNAFIWRSYCLEAFASFYAYGPLLKILEAPLKSCWTMMSHCLFRWTNKQPEIQKLWHLCSHCQDIYDWISPLNKPSGLPFILTQQSMGKMSKINLVICLFLILWNT